MQKCGKKDLEVVIKTISKKIAQFNWVLLMISVRNGLISREDFWKVALKRSFSQNQHKSLTQCWIGMGLF